MLNQLEMEILTALTCKVRVMSVGQLLRAWGQAKNEAVLFSLERLLARKLARTELWDVVLPNTDRTPLFTWKPSFPDPDTWLISKRARQRWKQPTSRVIVYQATELAGRMFGSRCGQPVREIERQHDLLLGDVYVDYFCALPSLAEAWHGEDMLPMAEKGVKNPDAFLMDGDLRPRRVIESTGGFLIKSICNTISQRCFVPVFRAATISTLQTKIPFLVCFGLTRIQPMFVVFVDARLI